MPEFTTQEEGLHAASSVASPRVLLVCHSPELRLYIQKGLAYGDIECFTVSSTREVQNLLSSTTSVESEFRAVLLELEDPLSPENAREVESLFKEAGDIPIVGIAPKPSADLVRDAMVRGVNDFLTNPFDRSGIAHSVKQLLASEAVAAEEAATGSAAGIAPDKERDGRGPSQEDRVGAAGSQVLDPIVTNNERMIRVLEIIDRVAPTDSTVLIEGDSGTGKELIARRIHQLSSRASGPFVEVHCGAIPPSLLESQMFGHEKGSFTGAISRQIGLFEIANRGTIFLDEIAEMHLEMQVKLLRVLQERTFRRIGGRHNITVDVRVVAATNRDLKEEVDANRFRADLYYRVNVISLKLPPLRERLEDIPDLVTFFAERFHREKGLPLKKLHPDTIQCLQKMRWIGNVREIENAVERLVLLSRGDEVLPGDFEEHISTESEPMESTFSPTLTLDEVKRMHISTVLRANNGNKMKTARLLGINVKTLYNLIQRLEIPT